MPEETNTSDANAVPEAPTVEELTAQLEALTGKYERAQKDISKFRTRADELEAARKEAEAKSLAEKSLQEQLEALKGQLTEKETAAAEATAKAIAAERKAALAGRVKDADYALYKINQTPDKFIKGDTVDVDAFLKAYPDHALAKAGPAPTDGGGGKSDKPDMNSLIRDAIGRA